MRRASIVIASASLLLAACGGGDDATADGAKSTVTVQAAEPQATEQAGGDQGSGNQGDGDQIEELAGLIDCPSSSGSNSDSPLVSIQFLLQLENQDGVDRIKDGIIDFDPKALLTALEAIRPLGGHDIPPFGDPAEDIEFYIKSSQMAAEILAIDGPVPQEKFDLFTAQIGDTQEFIMRQTTMFAAVDQACS